MAQAYALSGSNLLSFDTANPTSTNTIAITGVGAGETLVGLDLRPQNGLLYALGVNGSTGDATLYLISQRTGFAAAVGGSFGQVALVTAGGTPIDLPDPASTGYGFDFNPLNDRIRVTTGSGLNFRIDPNTGTAVDTDNNAGNGTNPDIAINGGSTSIDAAAYTNSAPNVVATTLYTLDAASNALFIQNTPNNGTQTSQLPVTLSGSPLDFTSINGFDIPAGVNVVASNTPVTTGSGFAVLNVGGTTRLYAINLTNGDATLVGNVGNGATAVQGFTVQNDYGGIPAIGLSGGGANLVRFNTATPGTTTTLAVTGLVAGETLVAIDYRPQTGQLYALGVYSGDTTAQANSATLYLLDPQNGQLSIVGTASQITFTSDGVTPVDLPDTATAGYGMDFNPAVDRLRITTDTGLNFRINPINGAPVDGNTLATGTNPDGSINGSAVTGVSAIAYTNSFGRDTASTGPTTLYTLDAVSNSLFIQNPPNVGTQTAGHVITLNGNPLDFTSVNGFDIPAAVSANTSNTTAFGPGFAALTVGGTAGLYEIDLASGVATFHGVLGAAFSGLALGDTPASFTTVVLGTQGDDILGLPAAPVVTVNTLGGLDTVSFGFKLVDATVTHVGNRVIFDTATQHIETTGIEKYVFTDGTVDNNDSSWLIDDLFYYAQNHDVWNAHIDADLHYNVVGWKEGRDPSALFDTSLYLTINPAVKAAGTNPLTHYDTLGWKQGVIASLAFGTNEYLEANPDVKAAGFNPLFHFLAVGASEGRQPIAPTEYLAPNGFDYIYYLANNPDVAAAGIDPFFHFQVVGWTEGRNPNALFDTAGYLAAYTDVAAAHINPLDHYHFVGFKEARDPAVNFDTLSYRSNYPDVAAANIDPLAHFLDIGRHEGRSAFADGLFR